MEQNKQKNSKRRLNSLILLVAFTAIMLIVSTYAWFSTQRNVSISNLEGTVKVAEGLEISLDADSWSQEIDFSQYTMSNLKHVYGDDESVEHNVIPTELIPASTTGTDGIGKTEMPLYRGRATQVNKQWQLSGDITDKEAGTNSGIMQAGGVGSTKTASDLDYNGYYAIDLFLRNSGITSDDTQGTTKETLQLTQGSKVTVLEDGNADTGLQNTPRVAFALYAGSADVTAKQSDVLAALTGADKNIEDVAIWEPNADDHKDTIVTNYNDIIWKTGDPAAYIAATAVEGKAKYTKTEIIPTYALTSTSVGKTYANLYNWDGTTNAGLTKQIALQTKAATAGTSKVNNLISVSTPESAIQVKNASGDVTQFQMLKNTTLRLRMYVWLEGQDPDCVNYASHGGGIEVNMGLCKGESTAEAGVAP